MVRLTLALGGLAASNILLSFAYQWFIFTILGTTRETDALFAGMVVPQLILAAVSGAMTSVLVPLLDPADRDTFQRDAWTFFLAAGLTFGGTAGLLGLLADLWVPWTVPGFDAETKVLTARLVRIQLLGMVFLALSSVLHSVSNARRRFVWNELSLLGAAAAGLAFLVWGLPVLGIAAAAWAFVLKSVLQTLLLLPGLGRFRRPDFGSATAREAWRRIRPVVIGTAYFKTDLFVDRFLTSMAAVGDLSLLHLAQQIYTAGHQIVGKAVGTPMVPTLADHARKGEWTSFRNLGRQRLLLILGFTAVVIVGIGVIGRPALSLLIGHGRIGAEDISRLWLFLLALGGMWVGFSASKILQASYYAKGDTVTPTRVGIFTLTLGLGLKVVGFHLWGVIGIAFATSFFNLLHAALLHLRLNAILRREVAEAARRTEPVSARPS